MNNLYNKFTEIITNYKIEETAFYRFCLTANQKEFLISQEPFFYAVKSFPKMLSNLASKIDSSENRLLIIENIWEEHGKGNKSLFHTETYKKYLKSLGHSSLYMAKNDSVDFWVNQMMEYNKRPSTSCEYAIKLCAIEFIYTRICILISETIQRDDFILHCEQNHYDLHAKLDVEHAKDLFNVAVLEHNNETDEFLLEIFNNSISDFLLMLNQLSFLTDHLAKTIAKEKIAFYYSRESSTPELESLNKINKNNSNILIICSGGEHISNISEIYPHSNIYAYDINKSQLDLASKKINQTNEYSFDIGKFELIFKNLQQRLFLDKHDNFFETINKNNFLFSLCNKDELAISIFKNICNDIFSNKNLEIIFTDNATKYSSDSFSNHFFNIIFNDLVDYYENKSDKEYINLLNILGVKYKPLKSFNNIKYLHGDTIQILNNLDIKFDLISISNIGDWMDLDSFIKILIKAKQHLNQNGFLISRKLLGDYNLNNVMFSVFGNTEMLNDETHFYSEIIAGKKTFLGEWN